MNEEAKPNEAKTRRPSWAIEVPFGDLGLLCVVALGMTMCTATGSCGCTRDYAGEYMDIMAEEARAR